MRSRDFLTKALFLIGFGFGVCGGVAAQENHETVITSTGDYVLGPVDPELLIPNVVAEPVEAPDTGDGTGATSGGDATGTSGDPLATGTDTGADVVVDETMPDGGVLDGLGGNSTQSVKDRKPKGGYHGGRPHKGGASTMSTTTDDTGAVIEHTIETTPSPFIDKTSGTFNYSVPFNVPSFHGLEPRLGLSYSSSGLPHGRSGAIVGVNWELTGLSVIERRSVGGGIATFDDARDLYQLDGMTLLNCAQNSIGTYPAEYVAPTGSSASCMAGGNLTAQKEDFRKIVQVAVTSPNAPGSTIYNFWVYDKDGKRYVYKSLGELANISPIASTDARVNAIFNRRFLLAEISDAQTDANGAHTNVVTFTYGFSAIPDGLAERPIQIVYDGYKINFGYQLRDAPYAPMSTFGVGNSQMFGRQTRLLRSVQVYDSAGAGLVPIRAYALGYASAALVTNDKVLTSVQEFGSSFTLGADGIVTVPAGGLKMPATVFTYSDDQPEFTSVTHTGTLFHPSPIFADVEPDGRSELIFPSYPYSPATSTAANYRFDVAAGSPTSSSLTTFSLSIPLGHDPVRYPLLLSPKEENSLGEIRSYVVANNVCTNYVFGFCTDRDSFFHYFDQAGADVVPPLNGAGQYAQALTAELDGDIAPEAFVTGKSYILNLDPSGPTEETGWPSSPPASATFGDFNGNGLTDAWWGGNIQSTLFPSTGLSKVSTTAEAMPSADANTMMTSGDVNGDGLDDIILIDFQADTSTLQSILVRLSDGYSFETAQIWYQANWTAPKKGIYYNKTSVIDINSDGLGDIVVASGTATNTTAIPTGFVFLSTGTSFIRTNELSAPLNVNLDIPKFIGAADINGDGLPDLARYGANMVGIVNYSTGLPANLLTSIQTPLGATYTVAYAPTSDGVGADPVVMDDQIPGVRQVVASIAVDDGRGGQPVVTQYRYSGGRYDEVQRKALGFTTVTELLPAIAGESSGPIHTVVYDTTSYAAAGAVKSDIVKTGDAVSGYHVEARTLNSYTTTGTGHGPFKTLKTDERSSTAYGTAYLETRRSFAYNTYGEPTSVIDWGRTDYTTGAGADVLTGDNTITTITYVPNTTDYIVGLPAAKRTESGTVANAALGATWLSAEYFRYDGNTGWNAQATEGNLTQHLVWLGDTASLTTRLVQTLTYDGWGNVLTSMNARGKTTSYTYDTTKRLFRTTTTNALAQLTETVSWNNACQAPDAVTDINGLVTSFDYDQLCRETKRTLPNGQYLATAFDQLGDPANQSVTTSRKSPALNANGTAVVAVSQSFFDGLGRTWKSVAPGSVAAAGSTVVSNVGIVTTRSYDDRGNLATQTNPLYADDTSTAGVTTYSYDALNRVIKVVFPNNQRKEFTYEARSADPYQTGTSTSYPGVTTRDELCFDAASQNTLCGKTTKVKDYKGHVIREITYEGDPADINADPPTLHRTDFLFDLLGRMTGVTDPTWITWAYSYDVFGNRLTASDPGLGNWTMSYDANGNLLTQTDAKGQTISFTYDALDRPTSKLVADTAGSVVKTAFTYDQSVAGYYNLGRLTMQKVSDPTTTATYTWADTITSNYTDAGQLATQSHLVDGKTIPVSYTYGKDGVTLTSETLPAKPGETAATRTTATVGTFTYDVAGRLLSYANGATSYVTAINYDAWNHPLETDYGNLARDIATYGSSRGWLAQIRSYQQGAVNPFVWTTYQRQITGRIYGVILETNYLNTTDPNPGSLSFDYDYAGRLLSATPMNSATGFNQTFTYDASGRMRTNSRVGTYFYTNTSRAVHAPSSVSLVGGGSVSLSYDANGNMLTGLDGKVMAYDAENRPLSVSKGAATTCYVYGADGARLKKITVPVAGQDCAGTLPGSAVTVLYAGGVEVQNWLQAGEKIFAYPLPSIRLAFTTTGSTASSFTVLHRDGNGSVRGITGPDGLKDEVRSYPPYGSFNPAAEGWDFDAASVDESKGWIGERFDGEAGLQYLNARYYDPKLGMFIQADWWEVTQAGVGTNRYAYAGDDPVNGMDPGGNSGGCTTVCPGQRNGPYVPGPSFAEQLDWLAYQLSAFDFLAGDAALVESIGAAAASMRMLTGEAKMASTLASEVSTLDDVATPPKILAQVTINRMVGKQGEETAREWLESEGYQIVSSQQTVATSEGKRVYDFVVKDPVSGELKAVEVKTDGATLTAVQLSKDKEVATQGGTVLGPKMPEYRDTNVTMQTDYLHVDSNTGCVTICGSMGPTAAEQEAAWAGNGGLY